MIFWCELPLEIEWDFDRGDVGIMYGDNAQPPSDPELTITSIKAGSREIVDDIGTVEMEKIESMVWDHLEAMNGDN